MGLNVLPPVIIVGMHRSGTTMLSQLLERLGLFTGEKKMMTMRLCSFIS